MQPSEFFEIYLLDGADFFRVKIISTTCHDKLKKFSTGYPYERLGQVHLQLMCSHDFDYFLHICKMIAFIVTFHCNIIVIALYGFTYMLTEGCIHSALICRPCILQSKGLYNVVIGHSYCIFIVTFSYFILINLSLIHI